MGLTPGPPTSTPRLTAYRGRARRCVTEGCRECDDGPAAALPARTGVPRLGAVVVHDLDVVAVGVEHERAVVPAVVVRTLPGRSVVAVARVCEGAVERIDRRVVLRLEGEVRLLRRLAGDEGEGSARACEL